MKWNKISLVVLAACGLSAGSPVFADPTMGSSGDLKVGTSDDKGVHVTGQLQSIDATSNTLMIKDDAGTTSVVKVDDNATIMRDGASVKVTDLKTGDTVTISMNPSAATQP